MAVHAIRKTVGAIVVSIAALATLAWLDERQEGRAALEDFAQEQAIFADQLAGRLARELAGVKKDAVLIAQSDDAKTPPPMIAVGSYLDLRVRGEHQPSLPPRPGILSFKVSVPVHRERVVDLVLPLAMLTEPLKGYERPASQLVLLLPPGASSFMALDGRSVPFHKIAEAVRAGATSVHIEREEAESLGLSRRLAAAGIARIDAAELGQWVVCAVASAERIRDREQRARTRLVLGVLSAGGLVLAFGAFALRRQRRELELSRELAIAAVERDSENRLEKANRVATLGTLAMGIAHEISTPAMIIQGRAEHLLSRIGGDERAAAVTRAILEQSERISHVVRGFLDLARGEPQSVEIVDAGALVDGALTLVEHRLSKAHVNVTTNILEPTPVVRGDRRLLEHALVNLLLNACDACPVGGTIQLEARLDTEHRRVRIDVLDEGVGIAPEHVALVTQPFFTTKDAGKGSGLGLAITMEIVRAHRGELMLAARSPRGTRATIELPAHMERQS